MKGKLIVIEGTDCSGKETQTKKLIEKLEKDGYTVFTYSYPKYDTPTGRIVGGPYLGKPEICEGWFPEGAPNVDYLVASCYYAADRRYSLPLINEHLNQGEIVILDRYTTSNMGHQGGKLKTKEERIKLFDKIDQLEFDVMELPRPDGVIFLHMPYEYACVLKKSRMEKEKLDQHEVSKEHLKSAENAYLELCDIYGFIKISCVGNDKVRTIDSISEDVYKAAIEIIEKK